MPDISRLVIEVDSKGVLTAKGDLEAFERVVGKAGKSTDDAAKKFGAFQLIANRLPGPLKSIASGLMGLVDPATAVVSAFLEIGAAAVKFGKESIDAFAKFETLKVNLEVVMGSASAASDMFDQLSRMAGRTPFNVEQLAEVATLLKTAGINAKDLIPTLEMLGNVSGGSAEKFNRIAYNFAQVAGVGKAASIDIKQFQMAGVPIVKMLEDIGKEGDTSFKAISEAIKQATSEGGMFFNAMEKGTETLTGMRSNLEGLKEQYKALLAELKGWGDLSKDWNNGWIDIYQGRIDKLLAVKKALEMINKLENSNALSERLEAFEYFQKHSWEEINELFWGSKAKISAKAFKGLDDIYFEKHKEIQSEYKVLQQVITQEKIRTGEIEKQLNLIRDIKSAYNSTMGGVNEIWAKTAQGQIEIIEEEINKLSDFRRTNQRVVSRTIREDGMWIVRDFIVELTNQDRTRIDAVIDYYIKKLEELNKGGVSDWAKVLAQATGFAAEDINSWGGLDAVEKYAAEGIDSVMDRFLAAVPEGGFIYEALGLNESDVYQDAAQKMQALVQMMTEARIEDPWSISDESYERALELLEKYNTMANASKFTEFIADLEEKTNSLAIENPLAQVIEQMEEKLKGIGIINPSSIQILKAIEKTGENYIANLAVELKDAGRSTYALTLKRLMIEQNISMEAAKQAMETKKQIDYITNGYDIMGGIATSIDDALRSIRAGNGGYGQYAGGRFAEAGMNAIQGSDAGNFAQGAAQGGWIAGLINMLVGALVKAVGGMEGFNEALNPITGMFEQMRTTLKAGLVPAILISRLFVELGKALDWLLNILTFGLNEQLASAYDLLVGTNDERQKEEERLRALNEQYARLFAALKEQEEYYSAFN